MRVALGWSLVALLSGCLSEASKDGAGQTGEAASVTLPIVSPFPLPRAYHAAVRSQGGKELWLDWRLLGHEVKPAMWPGLLVLFRHDDLVRENRRLSSQRSGGPRLFFIGTNAGGVVFALEERGHVVVLDEIELDEHVVIAPNFEALLGSVTKRPTP